MKRCSLIALMLGMPLCGHAGGAPDPADFVGAVVSVTRNLDAEEIARDPRYTAISATAWFYANDRFLVTAGHFTAGCSISKTNWTDLVLEQKASNGLCAVRKETIPVRLYLLISQPPADLLAILELQRPFTNAQVLAVRPDDLTNDAPVMALGYPDGNLRFVKGAFRGVSSEEYCGSPAGSHLYELHDGLDRLALDHGASGAPILDEDGRVVAVFEALYDRDVSFFPNGSIRTSTSWGNPNCSGIPADLLSRITVPGTP